MWTCMVRDLLMTLSVEEEGHRNWREWFFMPTFYRAIISSLLFIGMSDNLIAACKPPDNIYLATAVITMCPDYS